MNSLEYGLVLAVRQHLQLIEDKLKSAPFRPNQSEDETVYFQDQLNDLSQVKRYAMGKAAIYHRKKAREDRESFEGSMESLILGPNTRTFQVTVELSTESLVDNVEKEEGQSLFVSEREKELGERLYVLISRSSFEELTAFSCEYLLRLSRSDILSSSSLVLKTESVIDLVRANLKCAEMDFDAICSSFKEFLHVHLGMLKQQSSEELVNMLREQGNNLMSNRSYAQALTTYTQALDMCGHDERKYIPQLLTNRAVAYVGLFCFPEAISDLNEAVSREKTSTAAWTQLGYCQLYMGHSLLALRCYLTALKTLSGQIVPNDIDESDVPAYRRMKLKAVLPQFVQKISQSITLVEKRAYQQNELSSEIRKAILEVRRVLAILRSAAAEIDSEYFTYYPHVRDSMLRSISERVNRSRPRIMTPETGHNVLMSTGMGLGNGITGIPIDPFEPLFRETTQNATNTTANATTNTTNVNVNATTNPPGQPFERFNSSGLTVIDIDDSGNGPTLDIFQEVMPEGLRNVLSSFRSGHYVRRRTGNEREREGGTEREREREGTERETEETEREREGERERERERERRERETEREGDDSRMHEMD